MPKRTLHGRCRACLVLWVVVAGCSGAERLTDGHLAYNEAVRAAADRELLLNIVRLRYLDSMEFLSTASINSSLSFSVGLDAGAGRSGSTGSSSAGASVGYSSRPTFSFVPQRGGEFARQLQQPVDAATLAFLASVNRDTHQIFRLLVDWMNGLDNHEGEIDADFVAATRAMTELQLRGEAVIGFRDLVVPVAPSLPSDQVGASQVLQAVDAGLGVERREDDRIVFTRSERQPILYVAEDSVGRAELLGQLALDPTQSYHAIRSSLEVSAAIDGRFLSVRSRSLLQSLSFLAQGIDVPPDHLARGLASDEWPHASIQPVPMDDLFRVHHSRERPQDSDLAVRHRGYWFYVDDADATSKHTFFLLTQAFRFTLEHSAEQAPVLTLPIAADG